MPAEDQPFPSVWTRPRRQRREQPALSREQIVAEAIALLDAEGVDALSMRKLGTRLNAGATSMYTHVANKDELIELVVDEVYGEIEVPGTIGPDGWRAAVAHSAHSMRAAVLRHPWTASVLGAFAGAFLGPQLLRVSERMLALLESAGFGPEEADCAMDTVFAYVLGTTMSEAAWLTTLARDGRGEEEWLAGMWPAAEAAVRHHPRLRARHEARAATARPGPEAAFGRGLDCVLDGLESRRGA
ncbi:TetR/AcrR family transcriptional regulator [Streptomyces sp. NPDC001985]|uniref:TetR/AcrR family transcriptional regulator n=1 Tax=Streptomyces sp. NPDC001985 TaxID=3154406 RepID=UPI00331FB857